MGQEVGGQLGDARRGWQKGVCATVRCAVSGAGPGGTLCHDAVMGWRHCNAGQVWSADACNCTDRRMSVGCGVMLPQFTDSRAAKASDRPGPGQPVRSWGTEIRRAQLYHSGNGETCLAQQVC